MNKTEKRSVNIKIALFHAFFVHKGGGEKLIFELRNRFNADLYASSVNFENYNPEREDSFSKELFDGEYKFSYLHKESKNRYLRHVKRLWHFLFSNKIKELLNYDAVIFSGNVMFIQRRLKKLIEKENKSTKLVMYCHTPPRKLTDQFDSFINSKPALIKGIFRAAGKFILAQYVNDVKKMDLVITNSRNTQLRLKNYTGIDSAIIYPPINTNKFKYITRGDYFLSYARLDSNKRIPLLIDAFAEMPDKKLVICSTGPLHKQVENEIRKRNLNNISFEGLVTDERLYELVGKCLAGIYIPVNEDFGMTQLELMSAGKPVVGVMEGGLLETIIDGETGIMIKENPSKENLINAVNKLTPELADSMKNKAIEQAKKFDTELFLNNIENQLINLKGKPAKYD